MSSHANLSAATSDRKARLAQLKSLKRKAADEAPRDDTDASPSIDEGELPDAAATILSGRNYDAQTKGPKLGFEENPAANQATLEAAAAKLAASARADAAKAEAEDRPLDLFKLQPKKPNWDLKRDLQRKLEVLDVRTENAIARLVRERIAGAQEAAREKAGPAALRDGGEGEDGGERAGMGGSELVEAMHQREREEAEDERRERQAEDDEDEA
ncbi:uncharacterized protein K452DRAFT_358343 [Aplosporella prunicola CBS 121167]|uniref:Cwf18 pre-mRNA splicing factor n=1 Tax=Aplosporella prunicola CBS 121167 TaxID=1176127 RepID=A0A6A6BJ71_9PEZI|nr:uncharacterized protein K452DRAFT_358343 [Aplosporella prunicola CBS 121167]KAF2142601.1 hypothetical protein K452DRAFT_358343 [Aplosporella prunicola CBS 121167]